MSLASKLQIKAGQRIRLVNAPPGLSLDVDAVDDPGADAVLLFVRDGAELARDAEVALAHARQDRLTWIAYPKGARLDTDLNRDRLWALLAGQGVKPVRQVAIDETWSALRFRPDPPRA